MEDPDRPAFEKQQAQPKHQAPKRRAPKEKSLHAPGQVHPHIKREEEARKELAAAKREIRNLDKSKDPEAIEAAKARFEQAKDRWEPYHQAKIKEKEQEREQKLENDREGPGHSR